MENDCEIVMQPSREPATETELEQLRRRIAELEAEHRAVHEQFRAIIESSPLPIVTLTRDGLVTLWSPAAERLFGWTADEVVGKPLPFIPEDKREEHRAFRARDLSGEGLKEVEIRRVRKDGSFVDLRVSTAPLCDPSGTVIGIMSLYADITEQKRAERESQLARERIEQQRRTFDSTLSHTPDSIYLFDTEGRVVYANRALLTRWGLSMEQAEGKTLAEIGYPPELAERISEQMRRVLETGEPLRDETPLRSFTQGDRHYEYIFAPIFGADGRVEAVVGASRDITERRAVQEALRLQTEELARTNADLEQFAYSASHDLQEPLRMVAIFTQLLQRKYGGQLDEQADEYITQAVQGARRMEMLVRDLLAYTRVTVGEERAKWIEAGAVLERAQREMRGIIEQSGAVITCGPLPRVRISEVHLRQLFHNLIGNAIKYRSREAPRIEVAAERQEAGWVFSVRDNGIGIAPQYAEQVFGIFKRLHNKEEYEGTGIGLAICQKIVERYGGRIWVESQLGRGATFFFRLPAE